MFLFTINSFFQEIKLNNFMNKQFEKKIKNNNLLEPLDIENITFAQSVSYILLICKLQL